MDRPATGAAGSGRAAGWSTTISTSRSTASVPRPTATGRQPEVNGTNAAPAADRHVGVEHGGDDVHDQQQRREQRDVAVHEHAAEPGQAGQPAPAAARRRRARRRSVMRTSETMPVARSRYQIGDRGHAASSCSGQPPTVNTCAVDGHQPSRQPDPAQPRPDAACPRTMAAVLTCWRPRSWPRRRRPSARPGPGGSPVRGSTQVVQLQRRRAASAARGRGGGQPAVADGDARCSARPPGASGSPVTSSTRIRQPPSGAGPATATSPPSETRQPAPVRAGDLARPRGRRSTPWRWRPGRAARPGRCGRGARAASSSIRRQPGAGGGHDGAVAVRSREVAGRSPSPASAAPTVGSTSPSVSRAARSATASSSASSGLIGTHAPGAAVGRRRARSPAGTGCRRRSTAAMVAVSTARASSSAAGSVTASADAAAPRLPVGGRRSRATARAVRSRRRPGSRGGAAAPGGWKP